MLTLFDYLPSQNAWKVRQLLHHLAIAYRSVPVSIFEGEGRSAEYLRISPTGTVPAIQLDDGRTLAESNAILTWLAEGTPYLPDDAFERAKVQQWLCFEQERVESVIGALRHWTMTGKLARRPVELVESKRRSAERALATLERELTSRPFIAGNDYTIADMALFAYTSRAGEAGLSLALCPQLRRWTKRVEAQPGFLATMHAYAIDPHAAGELP
ncbi:MAG: glutathione S-transferase family protein [Rhodanobacter sp.]